MEYINKNIPLLTLVVILLSGCNHDKIQNETLPEYETSQSLSQIVTTVPEKTTMIEEVVSYTSVYENNDSNAESVVPKQVEHQTSCLTECIDVSATFSTYSCSDIETKITESGTEETSVSYEVTETLVTGMPQADNGESDEGGIH